MPHATPPSSATEVSSPAADEAGGLLSAPHVRVATIDLLRGIAVSLMVASHAADAFLSDAFRSGPLWHAVNIAFGFVAPAFLLLSGVTLALALERYGELAGGRWRLFRRALFLLLLGYWLQIPILSLRQLLIIQRPWELARMFDMNILHVIGIASIFAIAAHSLIRNNHVYRGTLALLALAIAVATPWVLRSGAHAGLPLPFRAIIAPQPIATFPLIPFLAYHLAGVAGAALLVRLRYRPRGWLALVGGGMAAIGAALGVDAIIGGRRPHDDFWGSSAQHVVMRAGGVIASIGCALPLPRISLLERIGRASLPIYVLHLVLIYGSPVSMGMRYWFDGALGRAASPPVVALIWIAITLLCWGLAEAWSWSGRKHPRLRRWIWWSWWLAFAAIFIAIP